MWHQCEYVGLLLWSNTQNSLSLLLFVTMSVVRVGVCGRGLSSVFVGTRGRL